MKFYLLLFCLPLLAACVFDPPLKGKEIIIENQTNDYVYVIDSLSAVGNLKFYDTFLVNKKIYIGAKGNYIPGYGKEIYFFSDNEFKKMKRDHSDKLGFYFIGKQDQNKTFQQIGSNKLYKSIYLNIDEIKRNALNCIFYYGDSIELTHRYDLETAPKN